MEVITYHNAFSRDWCEQTRSLVMTHLDPQEVLVGKEYVDREDLIKKRYRQCELRWLRSEDPRDWVKKIRMDVFDFLSASNNEHFHFKDLNCLESLQYTVYYGEQRGGYGWHRDIDHDEFLHNDKPNIRRLSLSLQISDSNEFKGGGLEFRSGKMEDWERGLDYEKLEIGREDLNIGVGVIFRSEIMHKAIPAIAGERHVLVAWIRDQKLN